MTFEEIVKAIGIKPYYSDDAVAIYHADCRDVLPLIPDRSIDLVLTDPPWDESAKDIYTFIGDTATRILVDGGLCMTYTGANYLGDTINRLTAKGLAYYWTFALWQPSSDQQFFSAKMFMRWRPILVTVKGTRIINEWVADGYQTLRDKRFHKWGQDIKPLLIWLSKLLTPNSLIIDYCMGGGTTVWAAKQTGNRCLGIEIEKKYCEIAAKRCSQSVMRLEVGK